MNVVITAGFTPSNNIVIAEINTMTGKLGPTNEARHVIVPQTMCKLLKYIQNMLHEFKLRYLVSPFYISLDIYISLKILRPTFLCV